MRKILLLSLALVLICTLIAAGAIGNLNKNLKSALTASSKSASIAKVAGGHIAAGAIGNSNQTLSAKAPAKASAKASTVRYTGAAAPTAPAIQKEKVSKVSNSPQLSTSNNVSVAGKAAEVSQKTAQLSPKEARVLKDNATALSYLQKLPLRNNVAPNNPPQIQTVYFSEGFENGGSIPAGWTDSPGSAPWLYNDGTGGAWMPGSVHGGSYCAYYDAWDYSGTIDSLISPVINLSGNGNYQLVFWNWDNTDPYQYPDTVAVHIKYGADPWTWLYKVPNATSGWTQNVVNFSTAATSIQIEFIGWAYFGYTNPCIDDINVQDPVVNGRCCYGDPRAPLCVDNIQQDCIDLGGTWTFGLNCTDNPCCPVPPNDRCEWVQPVPLGDGETLTFSGDNTCATTDGDCPSFLAYPNVWHAFTIDECMNVSVDFCGMNPVWGNVWLGIAIGCPCEGFVAYTSYNNTACGDGNYTVHFDHVAPGTYYVPVMLDPAHGAGPGPYTLHVSGVACPPPPPPDFQVTAPGTWIDGNTCNAGDDCNLRAGEDQIWQITIPEDGQWIFSLCNTVPSWDTYIYLGTTSCQADIGFNDDGGAGCGLLSKITVTIPAGVYYLDVEPYTAGTCNAYQLDVTEVQACVVTCPPNAIPEGEPDCYDGYVDNFNGGCNSTPNIYSEVAAGQTICGTAGIYTTGGLQLRDTDWYHFNVPQDTIVSVIGVAQFPLQMLILNYDCNNILQYAFASVVECDTARMSVTLTAGDYTIWAGPSDGVGVCGSPYWFTLNFEAPPPPPPADFQVTAPGTWTDGNTCGAGNDCSLRPSEDQIWEVTIPYDGIWTFSLCNTASPWDSYIYLGTTACSGDLGSNDDGCAPLSTIGPVTLTAGTYYLTVEGFSSINCGAYQLDITSPPPCVVTCPPNATPEGEPDCYDGYVDNFNGGCNSDPVIYSEVSLGQTICGAGGDYILDGLNYRDTDWYHFFVSQDTTVSVIGVAQFPLQMLSLNYDCNNILQYAFASVVACDTARMSVVLAAGDYTVWVGEVTGIGTPCGSPYWFTVTATAPPPPPPDLCIGSSYDQEPDWTNGLANVRGDVYDAWIVDDYVVSSETVVDSMAIRSLKSSFTFGGTMDYIILSSDFVDTVAMGIDVPGVEVDAQETQFGLPEYWYMTHIPEIDLPAGTYFLGARPVGTGVIEYIGATSTITGSECYFQSNIFGIPNFVPSSTAFGTAYDAGFCLFTHTIVPPPTPCEGNNVVYGQPDDGVNTMASQCDASYPFTAGVADDFILPGTGNVEINEIVTYAGFWNGPIMTPDGLLGIGVTIYADNSGVPGGQPIDGDPACGHQANIDGGIVYTHDFAPGEFTWSARASGDYQIELPLPIPETLATRTTYWLEFYPQLSFTTSGQVGWFSTSLVTGAVAVQGFPLLGIPYWTTNSSGVDVAFCLLGQSIAPPGCVYTPGDINGNHSVNGVDIVYAVNYLTGRGGPPPTDCFPACPLTPNPFYAAGDVNGNCAFNGIDITFFVRFLKLQVPSLLYCADCPPAPALTITPKLGSRIAPQNQGGQ